MTSAELKLFTRRRVKAIRAEGHCTIWGWRAACRWCNKGFVDSARRADLRRAVLFHVVNNCEHPDLTDHIRQQCAERLNKKSP